MPAQPLSPTLPGASSGPEAFRNGQFGGVHPDASEQVLALRLPTSVVQALACAAQFQGVPASTLMRHLLQAYADQVSGPAAAHTVVLEMLAECARQEAQEGGSVPGAPHRLEDVCGLINSRTAELAHGYEATYLARKRLLQIAALAVSTVQSWDRKDAGLAVLSQVRQVMASAQPAAQSVHETAPQTPPAAAQ